MANTNQLALLGVGTLGLGWIGYLWWSLEQKNAQLSAQNEATDGVAPGRPAPPPPSFDPLGILSALGALAAAVPLPPGMPTTTPPFSVPPLPGAPGLPGLPGLPSLPGGSTPPLGRFRLLSPDEATVTLSSGDQALLAVKTSASLDPALLAFAVTAMYRSQQPFFPGYVAVLPLPAQPPAEIAPLLAFLGPQFVGATFFTASLVAPGGAPQAITLPHTSQSPPSLPGAPSLEAVVLATSSPA